MKVSSGVQVWSALILAFLLFLPPAAVSAQTQTPPAATGGRYVLGPGDVLEVSVWGYADLTRVAVVRPDGRVSLPLVGSIAASGLSVERLTGLLTKAYAGYIVDPQVTVIIKEFRKIRLSVLGQVARPGTYELNPGARILDLLSFAGGVTEVAALREAQLLHVGRRPSRVDLERVLAGDETANILLNGGETLVVPEDLVNLVNVVGEVAKPGRYRLKGEMKVLDALLLAGGLTERASVTQARLVRPSHESQPLNLDALLLKQEMTHNRLLQPGDTLMIPEETNNKIYVLGDVNQPGVFPIKGEITLLQAIGMGGGPVLRGVATAKTVHIVRRNGNGRPVAGVKVEPMPKGGALITADLQAMLRGGATSSEVPVHPGDVVVVPQSGLSGFQMILSILSGIFGIYRWGP